MLKNNTLLCDLIIIVYCEWNNDQMWGVEQWKILKQLSLFICIENIKSFKLIGWGVNDLKTSQIHFFIER